MQSHWHTPTFEQVAVADKVPQGGKLARYNASNIWCETQVGAVMAALKAAGQFINTLFIVAGETARK